MKTFVVSFDINGEHYEAKVEANDETDAGLKVGFFYAMTWTLGVPLELVTDFTTMPTDLVSEVENTVAKEV